MAIFYVLSVIAMRSTRQANTTDTLCLKEVCFVLCCLMTPGLSKDIRYHVWI